MDCDASRWLGFPDPGAAIGQQVDYWGKLYAVGGVLKDYHQQSVKQAFEPHIFRFLPTGRDIRGLFMLFLTKEFLLLIIISFVVALPVTWYGIGYWLESFAMRMDLSAGLFLLPLLLVILITGLTIYVHVINAALDNQVDSIRDE